MQGKRIVVFFMIVFLSSIVFNSCKKMNIRGMSSISQRKSGNGKTPLQAIIITPTQTLQSSRALTITVEDNERWFLASMAAGKSYLLETSGTGDPVLDVFKISQFRGNSRSGEAFKRDDDSAQDGKNAKLIFTPPSTGMYYLRIILYAGSRWNGQLSYKIQ